MKAMVYTGAHQLEMQDYPVPEEVPGHVIVDVSHCGICGSDMHAYHGHDERRVPPLVLGHEAVGVARSGPYAGQRVAINPLTTCGTCRMCRSGAVHLCPERTLIGLKAPGGFAEQTLVGAEKILPLPDATPSADAALAEPLAVAVHAVRLGIARHGLGARDMRAAVLGGGAIGLLTAIVLAEQGVEDLWIAELNPTRREILDEATGARAYDPRDGGPEDGSADLVMDAVGSGRTRAASSALAHTGGEIVHIGLQDNEPGLDTRRLTLAEIGFLGVYCYTPGDFGAALDLINAGKVRRDNWAELRPLDAGPQSFRDIDAGAAPPKIILEI